MYSFNEVLQGVIDSLTHEGVAVAALDLDFHLVKKVATYLWDNDLFVVDPKRVTIPSHIQDNVIWHLYKFAEANILVTS